jgi:hypothetical protein
VAADAIVAPDARGDRFLAIILFPPRMRDASTLSVVQTAYAAPAKQSASNIFGFDDSELSNILMTKTLDPAVIMLIALDKIRVPIPAGRTRRH